MCDLYLSDQGFDFERNAMKSKSEKTIRDYLLLLGNGDSTAIPRIDTFIKNTQDNAMLSHLIDALERHKQKPDVQNLLVKYLDAPLGAVDKSDVFDGVPRQCIMEILETIIHQRSVSQAVMESMLQDEPSHWHWRIYLLKRANHLQDVRVFLLELLERGDVPPGAREKIYQAVYEGSGM